MLALVVVELLPSAFSPGGRLVATAGTAAGAAVMVGLAVTLGV
jgi:zinc transporter ZupT